MLVLTRKLQEQIRIGDNVTITVLRVKGQAVRIGIEAPRDVRVVRGELPRDGQAPQANGAGSEAAAGEGSDESLTSDNRGGDRDDKASAESLASHRLPQRRAFNRYGQPPLRLATSHALAAMG